MKIAIFLLILCVVAQIQIPFLYAENIPVDKLNYTGMNDNDLEKEAASLDIPAGCVVKYVSGMKNLNQSYQDGNLTRTEYITAKRNFIEDLQ